MTQAQKNRQSYSSSPRGKSKATGVAKRAGFKKKLATMRKAYVSNVMGRINRRRVMKGF